MSNNQNNSKDQNKQSKPAENPVMQYIKQENIQNVIAHRLEKAKAQMNTGVFVSNLMDIVRNNQDLSKVEPESVVAVCLAATMMGLKFDRNQGQAFVVPFGGVATLQIGWKGYKTLAIQSGQYRRIGVTEVYEFDDEDAVRARLFALIPPKSGNPNQIIGYVAAYELKNDYTESYFMSNAQLDKHRKDFSKGNPVWEKHPDMMRKKTVMKYLLKSGAPLGNNIYADQALTLDGHSAKFDDNVQSGFTVEAEYVNVTPVQTIQPEQSTQAPRQTQANHGNVPTVTIDSEAQLDKVLNMVYSNSIDYTELMNRYSFNEEQLDKVNKAFETLNPSRAA